MPPRVGILVQPLDRFQLGPLRRWVVRLLGSALLNQGAEGGLRPVLMQDPVNRNLPTAATLCVCSYHQLQLLIRHGLDLE
jgi:hypothetical protein